MDTNNIQEGRAQSHETKKKISASPTSGAVVTLASINGVQNLAFHKDAFTAAFAPLPVIASCEGYTARLPSGISVRVMVLVAAPEGIKRVETAHPDVIIFTASIDDGLNENGYIVPGLGDAGDKIFGSVQKD